MNDETWLRDLNGHRCSVVGKCKANDSGDLGVGNSPMQVSKFYPALEQSINKLQDGFPPLDSSPSGSCMSRRRFSTSFIMQMFLLACVTLIQPSMAAVVSFENCLSPNIVNSGGLQFNPFFVNATFNSTAASHNLNITVYGDVMGSAGQGCPNFTDPQWLNTNETLCKIPDVGSANLFTTLRASFNVLDYTPYVAPRSAFCNSTLQQQCPIVPSQALHPNGTQNDPSQLPAFFVAHELYSSYSFTTINAILTIVSGDQGGTPLSCVAASITPGLGNTISNTLAYIPLVILILVAIATICAAMFSPWSSTDVFKWTSNYGRDADLLRLVTPGFGDCLQYIQFIVLSGSLSLNYPGFFQPVVSKVSWSALMFNESFVSHGQGTQSLMDGVYTYRVNETFGLDKMSQLVGMTADEDIWAGMVVWLLAILAGSVVIIQIGFVSRWGYRHLSDTREEDLRAKNIPFTIGNFIRIIFNYFLLPVIALSTYQLVVARSSPPAPVGLAAILLFACVVFAAWLLWLVASTRPRSYLYDDLPTVLLYGPLYNTYSDNAATFTLVPIILTFVRGIAIGGVQSSGIAQLVLLAICEVIFILTLNAFRPFQSPTSMNAFHTIFAAVRLLVILLSVAFVPSLGVKDAPKGWIGYVILLMHAIVLIFGFFLNAVQTLIEVIARHAGAGGEEGVGGGIARGGLVKVFGVRQLSRRNPRRRGQARHSTASDAVFLSQDSDQKSVQINDSRSRSMSASSAILLNRQPHRASMGLDSVSASGPAHHHRESGSAPYTPTTSGGASAFSYLPSASQAAGQGGSGGAGIANLKNAEASADPWYRPPRARRPTNEALPSRTRSRGSWVSADWANKRRSQRSPEQDGSPIPMDYPLEGPSTSGRATPHPPYLGMARDRSDSNLDDPRRSKTDYAIREVDFYYGVRGRALSTLPTRRLKTGPADPTGPVSSATGWFKGLFGGKIKDKGKGFEVVRSSRAPLIDARTQPRAMIVDNETPYSDEPPRSRNLELSDDGDAIGGGTRHLPHEAEPSLLSSDDGRSLSDDEDTMANRKSQISQFPPSLPTIESGNGIELPSRIGSKASSRPTRENTRKSENVPAIPMSHSRRDLQHEYFESNDVPSVSSVAPSPPLSPQRSSRLYNPDYFPPEHLRPFNSVSKRLPFEPQLSSSQDTRPSTAVESTTSSMFAPTSNGAEEPGHARHSSSVLGALAPDIRQDRPSSLGYVQQHRASDNIHTASPDEPSLLSSSAEVLDNSDPRGASLEKNFKRPVGDDIQS